MKGSRRAAGRAARQPAAARTGSSSSSSGTSEWSGVSGEWQTALPSGIYINLCDLWHCLNYINYINRLPSLEPGYIYGCCICDGGLTGMGAAVAETMAAAQSPPPAAPQPAPIVLHPSATASAAMTVVGVEQPLAPRVEPKPVERAQADVKAAAFAEVSRRCPLYIYAPLPVRYPLYIHYKTISVICTAVCTGYVCICINPSL